MSEKDRVGVLPVVDVVDAQYPFALPAFVRLVTRGINDREVEAVVRRQSVFVPFTVVRDRHIEIPVLSYGEVGGQSALQAEYPAERPLRRKGIHSGDGQIVRFIVGGAVPVAVVDTDLFGRASRRSLFRFREGIADPSGQLAFIFPQQDL